MPGRKPSRCSSKARASWKSADDLEHQSRRLDYTVVNGPGEARETDIGFTGGGAGKDHGQVYLDGEPHHRLDNDKILDHLVELVEKKPAEIKAREEKGSVAAE